MLKHCQQHVESVPGWRDYGEGCFSKHGLGPLHKSTGNLNGQHFMRTLEHRVVPSLGHLFSNGEGVFSRIIHFAIQLLLSEIGEER